MKSDGVIIAVAYPEVVVKIANGEFVSKIWPLLGVGGKNRVMAGHAALLLVSKKTNEIEYYDFGRYITSNTYGRVRSKETDHEVAFPFKAVFEDGTLVNMYEIAQYLHDNPHITHGYGKVFIGVNYQIDFQVAKKFIVDLQNRGEVPYGPFVKQGSNCARFVADVIYKASNSKKIKNKLRKSYRITPSPMSTVIRGASEAGVIYQYQNNNLSAEFDRSVFKEHLRYLLQKVPQELDEKGTLEPVRNLYVSKTGQWLSGTGSGAWFELECIIEFKLYQLTIRDGKGSICSVSELTLTDENFQFFKKYEILHGSHAQKCLIAQQGKIYEMKRS